MTGSIGTPVPDCTARRAAAKARRVDTSPFADHRGGGVTMSNGEENGYGTSYGGSFHKGLPHDINGRVHGASYQALVRALVGQEAGALETLAVGANRSASGDVDNPPRYSKADVETPPGAKPLKYRKLTSPLTGHAFDTQGADAAALAIAPAPRLDSDELAAEMAELYAMALLRDVPFTAIDGDTDATVASVVTALQGMPWFNGASTPATLTTAETRRYTSRKRIDAGADLFRGSTPGARNGPWLSQFMLMGNDNTGFRFVKPNGDTASANSAQPSFRGTRANFGREDGYVLFGTQVIDQRAIVATEGIDYMTDWASWLDCQNGVDFNNLDRFRDRRRYLSTARDIATYVHYDALYQAYLVACLLMAADGGKFPKDRGMPETSSRTRAAFASFGGPHILSLVTEVATRALKAVWRQKWMHHRRARPEVVSAWLTLHAEEPTLIEDPALRASVAALAGKLPAALLDMVAARNAAQNGVAARPVKPNASQPAGFPDIADAKNFLLPMAFPEGSPTHPAYGAGHATVAGACVTVLKAFFEMFEADGKTPRAWPYPQLFVSSFDDGNAAEGGELTATAGTATIQGELDKLAANIAIARNMAGVHYYTDYYESLRLGERIAVSILEEQLSMYGEPVSMSFTSFDGDHVRVVSNGSTASVKVHADGQPVASDAWYSRYED